MLQPQNVYKAKAREAGFVVQRAPQRTAPPSALLNFFGASRKCN
jgi:hypothetical protein